MTSIGSSGLLLATQVDDSQIAKLVAVCSLGKVAGGRVPQQGEPPRVVLCGCQQHAEGCQLTLELWLPAKSATLPPQPQGLALMVHPCHVDRAVAFAGIVQTSCSFPPPNIRPALPPPPTSPYERELLQSARSALVPTGAAAPFLLRRLIAIFIEERRDHGLTPDCQLIRLLLGHQQSILQPAPVAASSRHSDLVRGRQELVAGMSSSGEEGRSWRLTIPSHPIPSHPIPSHPIPSRPIPTPSHPIPFHPIPFPIPPHPIQSRTIQSHPIPYTQHSRSHPIPSHHIPPHPIPSHLTPSHPIPPAL